MKLNDEEATPGCSTSSAEERISYISNFFKDRSVFITGATGFLGKVLLEKLLRSCSSVRTVYILLRTTRDKDLQQRMDELFASQVFHRIRREQPTLLTKVVGIVGDITLPGLGISQSDTAMILKHVSVVFHSAATVRFDETLKKSVDHNLVGTQRLLHLSQKMPKIEAFVHVSTAYSYCNREEIDEIVYQERVPAERVIEMTRWMDDDLIDSLLPTLMKGRPTTYHYTKALAENLLAEEKNSLPIAIVRPSIVTAAFKEPVPGWVDGLNGPSTFLIAAGRGLMRTMHVYKHSVVDWYPVDLVANLLLSAAWNLGTEKPNDIRIYNCTSGSLNRVTWLDVEKTAYPLIIRHPSNKVLRYPGGSFKSNVFTNSLSITFQHKLPAYLLDTLARIIGYKTEKGIPTGIQRIPVLKFHHDHVRKESRKKLLYLFHYQRFVSMVNRMERATGYLDYFTTKQWTFRCNNVMNLIKQQSPEDRELFNFDIRPVEWSPYLESYVLGVRKYLLKEDESTLPSARRRLRMLYYAEFAAKCICMFGFIHLLLTRTDLSNHIMWTLLGIVLKLMTYMPKSWLRALS